MLQDNSQPSNVFSAAPFDENQRPTITLPPPTSVRGHQRSRSTVELPPLFSRTASSSPTRSSTFLPFLRSASRSVSPERRFVTEAAEFDVEASSARESMNKQKPNGAKEKIASWFDGASEPVNITLVPSPRKEKTEFIQAPDSMQTIFSESCDSVDTLTRRPQRKASMGTVHQPRFSFFRKPSVTQLGPEVSDHDELGRLDIRDTLFPTGPPDEYSPAAFKNLQLNAEGTLRRFQSAHCEQQKVIRSVTSAKNIQADELEAAQTQNEHLKLQLIEMAEKSAEQERLIAALRADLDASRPSLNSAEAQNRSIRMVSQDSSPRIADAISRTRSRYRKNRSSDISTSGESENGSEISSAVSVFSDAMSVVDSPGTSIAASPVMKHATMHYTMIQHQQPASQHAPVIPVLDCQTCHGVRPSDAWEVIGMMKLESTALKDRITELEGASDDAIDFLSGLKLL